jgi:hypothetical protein
MSVLFWKNKTKRDEQKKRKIFSVFLVFVLVSINFFGFSVPTAHAVDAWYSGGVAWAYRVKVTINAAQVPSTQTNFPAYVNLANLPAGFWSNVKSTGADIRVTNSAGTELAREIESISTASSTGALWFKADSISNASYYYIYYGNASATEPAADATYGKNNVWDTNFKGVWHLHETGTGSPTDYRDSTSNASNGGQASGEPTATSSAQIGGAESFNGTTNHIGGFGDKYDLLTNNQTVSTWFKGTTLSQTGVIVSKSKYGVAAGRWASYITTAGKVGLFVNCGGSDIDGIGTNSRVVTDGNWHHIVSVWNRTGNIATYVDGVADGLVSISSCNGVNMDNPFYFLIGTYGDETGSGGIKTIVSLKGSLDELHISNTARSADWIATEYNNQSAPTTFYQVSAQEAVTVPNAPTGLGGTAGNLQVSLAWTAPAVDGGSPITDYVIEYKLTSGSSWTQIGHTPSVATSIVVNNLNAGLVNGTSYDFKVSAVNAVGAGSASNIVTATPATIPGAPTIGTATASSTQVSVAFTPLSNPTVAPWYGTTGWTLRKKITINKDLVPNTNQTNFPVLVSLTGLSNINANGTDIRFTSSDGATELAREIESYSVDTGTLVAWVKVPVLSSSVNTDIYMYYGNSSETTEPVASSIYGSQAVWDTGFKSVWHLKETTGVNDADSTSNGNTGTPVHAPVQTAGKIDGSLTFDGANDYISSATPFTIAGNIFTVSFWGSTATLNTTQGSYIWVSDSSNYFRIFNYNGKFYTVYSGGGTKNPSWGSDTLNTPQYIVAIFNFNNNTIKFFVNGVERTAGTPALGPYVANNATMIGARGGPAYYLNGSVDEVRISSAARSADWIATEYNNQSAPASFYAVAGEENVANSATNGGSAITNYTVTSSPEGITGTGATSPIVVSGLTNGTAYTFTVTATNAMGTGPASLPSNSATPATVPGAPTAVTPTYGDRQASLLWSAPASNGGSAITDYVIEYKLTSASDIPANWQISADPETPTIVATAVTGLINGTSYDFRITARNVMGAGTPSSPLVNSTPKTIPGKATITSAVSGDTQVTVNFTPLSNPSNPYWYNNSWTLRKKITIDKTKVPNTNQTNFPVLVSLTGLSNINANGTDIRFTSADGATELAREIESYADGTLVAWVKVPVLSTSANTDIYMYYGNPSATTEPGAGTTYGSQKVWDDGGANNFKGVWHMKETGTNPQVFDSTSNANNSTAQTWTPTTSGKVNGAGSFAAANSKIAVGTGIAFTKTSMITAEAWVNTSQALGSVITNWNVGTSPGWEFLFAGGSIYMGTTGATGGTGYIKRTTGTYNDGAWHHIVGTYTGTDASGVTIYVDGQSVALTSVLNNDPGTLVNTATLIGARADGIYQNGIIDEPRISSTVRSADWIATEYNNQSAPGSFYAVAGEESVSNSATNGGSVITNYTVTSNPDSVVVSSSTSPIIVTGLTNGTPYTFTMTATNVVGQGPASSPAFGPVTPAGVPGIPSGLIAVPGNALVDLSWTAPANNGAEITNYVIEYKLHSAPSWTQFGHAVSPLTTITVTDLVNGSLYDFRVSAVNSAGTGAPSTPAVESTPRTVPGQPAITSATRGNGQVTVNFNAPASDGGSVITSYTVTSNPQGITGTGGASPIIVSGLTNGSAYTFTVKATNVAGTGMDSLPSSSVTPATVPGKATEVTAVAGNTQAVITFVAPLSTGGSAITGYTVSSNSGGTDSNAGSTDLSHTVTGLTNGQTYTFTVVATNDVGAGLASDPSVAITLPTEPTAPLNVATEVKSSSIKLTWSDPASTGGSAITDYVIEYKLTTGGSWAPFDDGVSVDKFATVTGLSNGTSYDFRISAKNIIGTSEASSIVSASPGEPAQVFIQGFPDLTNTSIGTNIRITNEGVIEYEYQYTWCVTDAVDNLCGGGNDVYSASNAKLIDHGDDYDFTATSTVSTPGDYYFHINVLYGSASSYAFSSFTATATFPDPPTGVSAVGGNAQATVSFTIPASNGGSAITNYTVTSNPGALTGTGLVTPIIVTGLTNGTPYTFTMTATNIIGTGLSSSPPSNSVTPMTVPGIISGLTASAGNTQVGLSWTAPASDGGSAITDYVIEYKLTSDSSWSIFAEPISTVTNVTVTGLTNNLSYDFRVKAVNIVGQGPINSTSGTSVEPPPANTGGGSSGGRRQISSPITEPLNTELIAPNIVPSTVAPSANVISPAKPNIVSPTKPNEVTATPTETSQIVIPKKEKEPAKDTSEKDKASGIPWMWINISSLIMALAGLIIFVVRRRRIDNKFD